MKENNLSKIKLTDPIKERILYDIEEYFETERDEKIGTLGADMLLDFILEQVGPMIYNQALIDAHKLMEEKIEDLYLLELHED